MILEITRRRGVVVTTGEIADVFARAVAAGEIRLTAAATGERYQAARSVATLARFRRRQAGAVEGWKGRRARERAAVANEQRAERPEGKGT